MTYFHFLKEFALSCTLRVAAEPHDRAVSFNQLIVETVNDDIRPSISGAQSASRLGETSKNNSDDSSTDMTLNFLNPLM